MLNRQGDVFWIRRDTLPEGLTEVPRDDRGRIVLAEGEVTGHAHALECDDATFLAADLADLEGRFLVIEQEYSGTVDAWKCANDKGAICWVPADVTKGRLKAAGLTVLGREDVVGVPLRHEEHLPIVIAPGIPVRHLRKFKVPLELAERCDAWVQLSRSLGHFWAFGRIAILSERMSVCHVDGEGALHSEDGPAMAYRDGTEVYAIHGVRVPERVVKTPASLSVKEINDEENAEIRRVMRERFGSGRYLKESGAELIHEDVDEIGFPRRLYRLPDDGNGEPFVMVEVVNSTPEPFRPGPVPDGHVRRGKRDHQVYWLRVPPSIERARQAVAWTAGVDEDEYELVAQS